MKRKKMTIIKNTDAHKGGNNIKDLQREMLKSILSSKGLIFRHYQAKFQQKKHQLNQAHFPNLS